MHLKLFLFILLLRCRLKIIQPEEQTQSYINVDQALIKFHLLFKSRLQF